jgi:uncharacterized coiled-coil protein SlyX
MSMRLTSFGQKMSQIAAEVDDHDDSLVPVAYLFSDHGSGSIDNALKIPLHPDAARPKSVFWWPEQDSRANATNTENDTSSTGSVHFYVQWGDNDNAPRMFGFGGFQIVSHAERIETFYTTKENPEKVFLMSSRGIPHHATPPDHGGMPWYKATCVVPGGPRVVCRVHLQLLGTCHGHVASFRLTARSLDAAGTRAQNPDNSQLSPGSGTMFGNQVPSPSSTADPTWAQLGAAAAMAGLSLGTPAAEHPPPRHDPLAAHPDWHHLTQAIAKQSAMIHEQNQLLRAQQWQLMQQQQQLSSLQAQLTGVQEHLASWTQPPSRRNGQVPPDNHVVSSQDTEHISNHTEAAVAPGENAYPSLARSPES